MHEQLIATVAEAEKLVQQARQLVDKLESIINGPNGNRVALLEDVQQGQQQPAHAYHLGHTAWNYLHDYERAGQGRVPVTGLKGSSRVVETLCKLGRTVECEHELERWENEGGTAS
jgi:hypothetical protein